MRDVPVETWAQRRWVSRFFRADSAIDPDRLLIEECIRTLPDGYMPVPESGDVKWLDPRTDLLGPPMTKQDEWAIDNDMLLAVATVRCAQVDFPLPPEAARQAVIVAG